MWSAEREKRATRKGKFIFAILLIAFVVLAFYYSSRIDESRYDALIEKSAKKYNIDGRFIKAVIYQESKFDPNARGAAGEIGLMQIMPNGAAIDWAKHHKIDHVRAGLLFKPELNIEIGSWYLAQALKRWHNYKHVKELALCQYNAGGKRANTWKPMDYQGSVMERIKINSTRAYVASVMGKYKQYCDAQMHSYR